MMLKTHRSYVVINFEPPKPPKHTKLQRHNLELTCSYMPYMVNRIFKMSKMI